MATAVREGFPPAYEIPIPHIPATYSLTQLLPREESHHLLQERTGGAAKCYISNQKRFHRRLRLFNRNRLCVRVPSSQHHAHLQGSDRGRDRLRPALRPLLGQHPERIPRLKPATARGAAEKGEHSSCLLNTTSTQQA